MWFLVFRLRHLPPTIGGLTALVELFLTDNLLEALPQETSCLTSLVKLQVGRRWGRLVLDIRPDESRHQRGCLTAHVQRPAALLSAFACRLWCNETASAQSLCFPSMLFLNASDCAGKPAPAVRRHGLRCHLPPPSEFSQTAILHPDIMPHDSLLSSAPLQQASFNALTELPPGLGALSALELCRVACCAIGAAPAGLAAAPALAWLSLGGNPCCAAPPPPRSDTRQGQQTLCASLMAEHAAHAVRESLDVSGRQPLLPCASGPRRPEADERTDYESWETLLQRRPHGMSGCSRGPHWQCHGPTSWWSIWSHPLQ